MHKKFRLTMVALYCLVFAGFGLSGCTTPDVSTVAASNDYYEKINRKIHWFNKSFDRAVLRPVSRGYAAAVPKEARIIVSNFSENLSQPGLVVNNLLQGDVSTAGHNTARFAVNSTVGFIGLFDPSTDLGLAEAHTDFGQTLHVWKVPQGAYLELPFFGPSSERAAVGTLFDFFTNPLGNLLNRQQQMYRNGALVASVLDKRDQYDSTIDSVLYESADSYKQSRLIYLQNRNFELGESDQTEYDDPYFDPYGDAYD